MKIGKRNSVANVLSVENQNQSRQVFAKREYYLTNQTGYIYESQLLKHHN